MPDRRVVVLGAGSTLLSDSGAGARVLARLAAGHRLPGGVRLVAGAPRGAALLEAVQDAQHLVIVAEDPACAPPEAAVTLTGSAALDRLRVVGATETAGLCDLIGAVGMVAATPPDVTLIALGPQPPSADNWGPAAAAALDRLVQRLNDIGAGPRPRTGASVAAVGQG